MFRQFGLDCQIEKIKFGSKLVLNAGHNNDNSSGGDHPELVVLESSAKPSLGCQDNHN